MKIVIIRPSMTDYKAADALQPLAVAVLAGLTPADIEIEFYDDRIENLPEDLQGDLIVLSVETFAAQRAYQLAQQYRPKGIPIVMGGYHPTFMPEEALLHCDAVIIGEAEGTWPQVIADLKQGRLKRIYRSDSPPSLERIQYDRTPFKNKKYAPLIPIQFGRGCRYSCEFCSIHAFYGSVPRHRDLETVLLEMAQFKGQTIFIVDDNFLADRQRAIALLKAMIPLKVKWFTQISIEVTDDNIMLDLMVQSGCIAVLIGFESLEEKNLHQMGKGINLKHNQYSEAVKKLQQRGIMVYGTFVFGYDYDTPDTVKKALDFALENRLMLANFNTLMVMPGTRLYERMVKENRLIHPQWWLASDFRYGQAMFRPKGMSPEVLTQACHDARVQFNSWGSIAHRLSANCSTARNLGVYLTANMISRKEVHRKQGLHLGAANNQEETS